MLLTSDRHIDNVARLNLFEGTSLPLTWTNGIKIQHKNKLYKSVNNGLYTSNKNTE